MLRQMTPSERRHSGEEPATEPAPTDSGNTALDEALTAASRRVGGQAGGLDGWRLGGLRKGR